MCLYLKKGESLEPRIAKKNIKVYKILINNNITPFRRVKYEKNCIYTSKLTLFKKARVVENGLHALTNKSDLTIALCKPWYYSRSQFKVVQMTIPKGAYYYLGTRGDIVSDILIW